VAEALGRNESAVVAAGDEQPWQQGTKLIFTVADGRLQRMED
jgi:hypothetical protein